jgi:amidohydrolase
MNDQEILRLSENVYGDAVRIRRRIHEYPEPGRQEFRTTALITELLKKWNIEVLTPLETGAVGILRCGNDPAASTIALRADIDALAVSEQTGLEYASKIPVMMHACGHDIHTAALLAAAEVLSENRSHLNGTVVFIFQPDEEGSGGAERLVQSGVLDDVDRVFGFHIMPKLPAGTVAVKYGKSYAASDVFEITVKGKSAHAASPHSGVNAVAAAAAVTSALMDLPSRLLAPTDSAVLQVCQLNGGSAVNVIPDRAVLTGTVRTLGPEARELMREQIRRTAGAAAASRGACAEVRLVPSYPGIVNHDEDVAFIERSARELLGDDHVRILSEPFMTTEDFGYYLEKCGGCFYQMGAGDSHSLHSSELAPDERTLKTAVAMHLKTIFPLLGTEREADKV